MTRAARPLRAALALLLAGCSTARPAHPLPDQLALALVTTDGLPISLLVELPRPGFEPQLRLSPGLVVLEPGRMLCWLGAGEGGAVEMHELGSGRSLRAELPPGQALRRLAPTGAWLEGPEGPRALGWLGEPGVEEPSGELRESSHPGPGGGFALRLEGGNLELRLPREEPRWTAIVQGVERLLAATWIDSARLPPWQRRAVDDRFKQVGIVPVTAGEVVPDGALEEWAGTVALRVGSPAQLLLGQSAWGGERDAGMGLAARQDRQGRLWVGLRIRDDAWTDQDALMLRWAGQQRRVPLARVGQESDPSWAFWVARPRWTERTVEILLPGEALAPLGASVPGLIVELIDVDPGQPASLLSTSPWVGMEPVAARLRLPEGPERGAPQ